MTTLGATPPTGGPPWKAAGVRWPLAPALSAPASQGEVLPARAVTASGLVRRADSDRQPLNLGAFRQRECILDVDAKIPNRAFDFSMAEENLDGTEISRGLVDDRCFCPPQRVRSVVFAPQPDCGDPLVDQPCILSRADVPGMITPTWEGVVVQHPTATLQPNQYAGSRRFKQLELYGPAGLLLHHNSPAPHPPAADKVSYPDLDDVAAPQLAVDGEVKQRSVAKPPLTVEPEPYGPNLRRLQSSLPADDPASVPGAPTSRCWIIPLQSPVGQTCPTGRLVRLPGHDGPRADWPV
jgi:hypothetical protein